MKTVFPSKKFWNQFANRFEIYKSMVPLFKRSKNLIVETKLYGQNDRKILKRSDEMEEFVIRETNTLVRDYNGRNKCFDGLIYIMPKKISSKRIIPLYIGKAETVWKNGNLSENLKNLASRKDKFARWGDNYQYHIGDLSAATCGHAEDKIKKKYKDWSNAIFEHSPVNQPKLRKDIFLLGKSMGQK